MRQSTSRTAYAIAFFFLSACCAYQQSLNIWPGVAPGYEHWTQKKNTLEDTRRVILNAVTPTLTAYLPDKAKATGTGIIVAPGRACIALTIEPEGTRWAESVPPCACYSAISQWDRFYSSLFRGGPFCCGLWPSSTSSAAVQTSFGFG